MKEKIKKIKKGEKKDGGYFNKIEVWKKNKIIICGHRQLNDQHNNIELTPICDENHT